MWNRVSSFVRRRTNAAPGATASLLLALVVLVGVGGRRPLWDYVSRGFGPAPDSYGALRLDWGFSGLKVNRLQEALSRRLGETTPVSLSPTLKADPFARQRIAEGIYPRRVIESAPHVLDVVPNPDGSLVPYPGRGFLTLVGKAEVTSAPQQRSSVLAERNATHRLRASVGSFLLALVAVLGWGWLAWWLLCRAVPSWMPSDVTPVLWVGAVGVFGAGIVGTLATLSTWLQVPVGKNVVTASGLILFALATGRWLQQQGPRRLLDKTQHNHASGVAGLIVAGTGLLFFVRQLLRFPIVGWDGRSIWLFRAHQLAHEGFFSIGDAGNREYLATHPSYPLLFPAWLSQFTAFGPYDERQGSLGIAALLTLLVMAMGGLIARQRGMAVALGFAGAFFLAALVPLHDGYPDMIVTGFLLVAILGFANTDTTALGLAAILAAALTKREGLVLGAALLLLVVAMAPQFRAAALRKRSLALLVLLPALGHVVWYRTLGLPEIYADAAMPEIGVARQRVYEVFRRFVEMGEDSPFIVVSVLCLIIVATNPRRGGFGLTPLLATLAAFAFTVVVFVTTPLSFSWQLSVALPRVVMHAVWMGFAAGLLHLQAERTSPDASSVEA